MLMDKLLNENDILTLVIFCAKPKGDNCLLEKWAVTAFWLRSFSVYFFLTLQHRYVSRGT